MNTNRLLRAVLILVSCSCLAAEDKDGPESVDQRWQAAMRAGDTDGVMSCYASDAIAWLPDSPPARGTEAIRAAFAGMLQNNTVAVDLTNTHVHTCGDMAMVWGEYSITVTPKSGGSGETATGRYTEILKKEKGKWVYAVDHASANPASTPSPTP